MHESTLPQVILLFMPCGLVLQIFGYVATFVWLASVWFVFKDTPWHKDVAGPLASIYNITSKQKDTSEAQQESSTEQQRDTYGGQTYCCSATSDNGLYE